MDRSLLASLQDAVAGPVAVGPEALESASRDASAVRGRAEAVVRPADREDTVALVGWARSHRVALTARGGGTSLDGESVPVEGGVVVDFSGWTALGTVDLAARTIRVGPGVVNRDLHETLRPSGLFFPPNPGSWHSCTVGGNIGTNASGPRSFRYGPTRRWLHAAELVLGTGELVDLGPSTAKRSVGPELLEVIVGSEGTLGLVTSATLRLARSPPRRCGIAVPVPTGAAVGSLANALARRVSLPLSALEFVDAAVAEALRGRPGARLPGGGGLILLELESEGPDVESTALSELEEVLRQSQIREAATVLPDADRMWSLRGEAGGVVATATGPSVREDVAVPLDRIDRLIAVIGEIASEERVASHVYGHLGQGNLHPTFAVSPTTPAGRRIRSRILEASRALGGTVSGEQGVGAVKRDYLPEELGPVATRLLGGWKALCDPDAILNPGKLLPEAAAPVPSPGRSPPDGEAGRTPGR